MSNLAIIGGSGIYKLDNIDLIKWIDVKTKWGMPSDSVALLSYEGKEFYFLPRHGRYHSISPSNINYQANIEALKRLKVENVISISAVGSLKEDHPPGKFVLVDQFIDQTYKRNKSFFENDIIAHVSMANPTNKQLRINAKKCLDSLNIANQNGGVYVAIEGPQFSSQAESKVFRSFDADVIGMTNMPEAKLVKEAEMRYLSVSMVTDYDCWHPDHESVSVEQIIQNLNNNSLNAQKFIQKFILNYEESLEKEDEDLNSLKYSIITPKDNWTKETINNLEFIISKYL